MLTFAIGNPKKCPIWKVLRGNKLGRVMERGSQPVTKWGYSRQRGAAWQNAYLSMRPTSLIARLWSRVSRAKDDECWLWAGSTLRNGYGQISVTHNGHASPLMTHRVMWVLTYGPIPDGLSVLHRCDVPRCVNPTHLFLGTQRDNIHDAQRKGRLRGRAKKVSH